MLADTGFHLLQQLGIVQQGGMGGENLADVFRFGLRHHLRQLVFHRGNRLLQLAALGVAINRGALVLETRRLHHIGFTGRQTRRCGHTLVAHVVLQHHGGHRKRIITLRGGSGFFNRFYFFAQTAAHRLNNLRQTAFGGGIRLGDKGQRLAALGAQRQ